ncbi:hypothetical protein ACHAWC_004760 [Mediolabrus comicus]
MIIDCGLVKTKYFSNGLSKLLGISIHDGMVRFNGILESGACGLATFPPREEDRHFRCCRFMLHNPPPIGFTIVPIWTIIFSVVVDHVIAHHLIFVFAQPHLLLR